MTLAGFFAYCLALGIAVAIPGPGITALVGRSLATGLRHTMPMLFGVITGDLVYLIAVIAGLTILAQNFGGVIIALKYLGAAYLAYLAYKFWTAGLSLEQVEADSVAAPRPWLTFLSGLFVTLGNPKTMIFYVAITPTIIDLNTVTWNDAGLLAIISSIILFTVLFPYIALAAKARIMLKTPTALKRLNRVAAVFIGGAALAIAVSRN